MDNDINVNDLENVSGGEDSGANVCKMCGNTRSLSEIFLTLGFKDSIRDRSTVQLTTISCAVCNRSANAKAVGH